MRNSLTAIAKMFFESHFAIHTWFSTNLNWVTERSSYIEAAAEKGKVLYNITNNTYLSTFHLITTLVKHVSTRAWAHFLTKLQFYIKKDMLYEEIKLTESADKSSSVLF